MGAKRLAREDGVEGQSISSEMSQEAKIKADSDNLKEELVKKKVELSMHESEDKRVQEQLKRIETQKDAKQAELDKAKKTLTIAQTANEAEQKSVTDAENDVRNAAAEGKVHAQAEAEGGREGAR